MSQEGKVKTVIDISAEEPSQRQGLAEYIFSIVQSRSSNVK